MKHRRKLRRGAILALVLVMLCNAIPAKASTTEISVGSYEELIVAIEQAENMDTIVISSRIFIPKGSTLGDSTKQVILKYGSGGYIEFELDASCSVTTTISNIVFDGDGKNSSYPMLLVRGKVDIINCKFQRANAGAVRTAYTQASFTDCIFTDNVGADYGAHINASVQSKIVMDNCSMYYGTAKARGGAVHIDSSDSSITIKNSLIYANESALGGGISCTGTLVLEDTVIYNNKATTGGADLFMTGTYQIQTIEEMAEVYHEKGLEPLSWESDYEDLDYGGTCLKLTYEAYTDPTPTPPSEEDTGEDIVDPIIPPNEEENDQEIQDPNEGSDQEETPPNVEENEGESSGEEETPPASEEKDPEEGDIGSTEEQEPNTGEQIGGDTNITNNIDNTQIDSSGSGNSSVTDNSVSNGDTVTNSSQNIDNSSSVVSGDTVTNSSQNSDSSVHNSNTDNSSYNEDHSYRDNSSSTVNNYYQQEATGGSQNGSQPINIEVPVNVTIPEQKEPATGSTQAPEQAITVPQDIKIEAEGVDLVYEYTENGVSISIKAIKETESTTPTVTPVSTPVMATEAPESPQESPNWVEVVTMILLAVLVLGELRDKWKSRV